MFVEDSDILNDFIILSKIGGENYSTIYKVIHKQSRNVRAIKIIDLNKLGKLSSEFNDELKRRITLLNQINDGRHTNIVRYYNISHQSNYIICEMEYIKGVNIDVYLNDLKGFVETKEVIKLLGDIGGALKYLHNDICLCINKEDKSNYISRNYNSTNMTHDNSVIHNDIHTWNIIRNVNGKYILIDCDFAIEGSPNNYEKQIHMDLIGAPWFKAPEKWDENGIITTRSDIYSFGIVLYRLLTGDFPFILDKHEIISEASFNLIKIAHKQQKPTSIFELRQKNYERTHPGRAYIKDFPDWLEYVIMKCMSKNPDDRFQDGGELYEYVQSQLI